MLDFRIPGGGRKPGQQRNRKNVENQDFHPGIFILFRLFLGERNNMPPRNTHDVRDSFSLGSEGGKPYAPSMTRSVDYSLP